MGPGTSALQRTEILHDDMSGKRNAVSDNLSERVYRENTATARNIRCLGYCNIKNCVDRLVEGN